MRTINDIELEIKGLEQLKKDTEEYQGKLFDWLSTLNQTHLISHFYDLECDINLKLEAYKKELEELRKAEEDE